ncbi:MAG: gluconokinase [Actinobacteria bacterium]|uniref:Gluconokinase n=1 Tax=Nostocoides veronense TaxID=330836 RepID=A0ABP4XQ54_9MICO|nr:gluconokinase [Actinomycetota bacterium]
MSVHHIPESRIRTRHVVVMGVSGCGKSTVAKGVAEAMNLPFAEADRFHPEENVAKMAAGIPLNDDDRYPWLRDLSAWMATQAAQGQSTTMACSALKREYRDILRAGPPELCFIHLNGPMEVIAERMAARTDHFMPVSLLASQFEALQPLEPDEVGVVLDLRKTPEELIDEAATWLRDR